MRARISEAQHLRWNEVKTLKKLPSDNAVARYLLDLAAEFDEGSDPQVKWLANAIALLTANFDKDRACMSHGVWLIA